MRVWCYNGIWLQSFSYHLSSLRRKSCGKEKARTRIKEFGHRDKWLGGVNGLQFRTSMREEAGRWRGKGRGWEDKPFSPFLSLSILAIERGRLSLLRRGEPHFEPVCAFRKDRRWGDFVCTRKYYSAVVGVLISSPHFIKNQNDKSHVLLDLRTVKAMGYLHSHKIQQMRS